MSPVSSATPGGAAYVALRREAKAWERSTEELLQLYVLEGFLSRLATSGFRDAFVLKGGVLLAALDARRPTKDIDLAALDLSNDAQDVMDVMRAILVTQPEVEDGIVFEHEVMVADVIRDDGDYSGVRVKSTARLATARVTFHVDVNVGDAIWPAPSVVQLPRLLGGRPIEVIGYPLAMIFAEKAVTAIQHGTTNTRWRDFADIWTLSRRYAMTSTDLSGAIDAVARHRGIELLPLSAALSDYSGFAQPKWQAWRRRLSLDELPEEFAAVLEAVIAFIDPVLNASAPGHRWNPVSTTWKPESTP